MISIQQTYVPVSYLLTHNNEKIGNVSQQSCKNQEIMHLEASRKNISITNWNVDPLILRCYGLYLSERQKKIRNEKKEKKNK